MSEEQNQTGMVIRGADGKMYYVTDAELAPYQMTAEQVAKIEEMYDVDNGLVHVIDQTDLEKVGLKTNASVVAILVSVASLRKWRNRG